ncbi:GDSL esterase/lipase At5g03610-like isoform X2 [Andrographis paniculata]|uniref:GDSL esterase/lipase At5g03610-like isoform X2 n=1 Tax=Andrographis paniculata TaxID=175694 RepID=UPI0021E7A869|nr:GDSL esterase/lipase At5g03610-like isoform X2 [Andrographis paniculata]
MVKRGATAVAVFFFFVSFALQLSSGDVEKKTLLFVFGDSYADTGNLPREASTSWKWPYGITFPGKPSGRFSDGRVFTDFIAKFLGIKSPIPYKLMKNLNTNSTRYGINFAHGGTGVFKTMVDYPNMSTQIDFLQQIIDRKVYSSQALNASIALVSLAGNDYSTYLAKNGSLKDLPEFSKSVIGNLTKNIKRIRLLGIKKIVITGLHPLGCLPLNIATNAYRNCNTGENYFSESHNRLLKQNIETLNDEVSTPVFAYLDIYDAFISSIETRQNNSDKLKPCCVGANGEGCGWIDNMGKKLFDVCKNRKNSLFWDSIHPSDAGWRAVYSWLKPSLASIFVS